MPGRKNKGAKTALQREMAESGEFAPKVPGRTVRKERVTPTVELCREMIGLFSQGKTLTAIERDPRYPTRRAFSSFVGSDAVLLEEWERAKADHAWALMEEAAAIVDRQVIGPDGRHDNGAVARDRLRSENRHLRAAALAPAQWGKKSELSHVGDVNRPIVVEPRKLTGADLERILAENEAETGLPILEGAPMRERLRNIQLAGQPTTPELYQLTFQPEEPQDGSGEPQDEPRRSK